MSLHNKCLQLHTFESVWFGKREHLSSHFVSPNIIHFAGIDFHGAFKQHKMLYEGENYKTVVYVEWTRIRKSEKRKFEMFK